jgi:hypothetical protein
VRERRDAQAVAQQLRLVDRAALEQVAAVALEQRGEQFDVGLGRIVVAQAFLLRFSQRSTRCV